ncbi:MAG: putative rane protein [Francisellaceae bacterium]|nr:putative rane protein [Francisellaceae bacterium]
MKKPLVIFGTGKLAELAHYYFSNDSNYKIVAFTLDEKYIQNHEFCKLPVIPFEQIHQRFSAKTHYFFIALGYSKVNQLRKEKYLTIKELGYKFASYINSNSTILYNNYIGENCFILENNTIQPFARIGNNVIIWCGNIIGHNSIIEDHCFIASQVVISGGVVIKDSSFIGVNATLRDYITIGEKCIIGAGALILSDTKPEGIYIGHAAQRSRLSSDKLKKL